VAPERTWSIASRVVTVDSQALGESSPHPHPVVGEVQEGFLHDVCGLAHAAHDPVGDGEQQRPEVLVHLCSWLSGSILTCMFSHPDDAVFPSVTQIGDSSTLPLGGAPPASSLLHLLAQPVSQGDSSECRSRTSSCSGGRDVGMGQLAGVGGWPSSAAVDVCASLADLVVCCRPAAIALACSTRHSPLRKRTS
jgi:hypothetical protein